MNQNMIRRFGIGTVLLGTLTLAACDNATQLRVIHASADAPPVNVTLDGDEFSSELDYGQSTGFQDVLKGRRDINVEAIIPGGNADVITVDGFRIKKGNQYTILAVDETASISELVVRAGKNMPGDEEVDITVVHASPDAAAANVDVYVTGPDDDITGIDPSFNFDFTDDVEVGVVPAAKYRIRVTGIGSKAAAYDSGEVDLTGFGGQKLLLVAVPTVNQATTSASPIKIIAYTDDASIELLDQRTLTAARVVHLSPDAATAAAGPVEVFATSDVLGGSVELIDAFAYTDVVPATGYVEVPAGDYVFDVAPDGTGIGSSVFTSDSLSLAAGSEATVIASGYVLTTPAFTLLASGDDNRSVVTQASVKVVHAAPLAGTVDVYVTPAGAFSTAEVENGLAGDPLLPNFEYATITDYVPVAPGDYDIRVVAGGTAAIDIQGFNLAAGSVSTVIARQPADTGTPTDFGVVVLTN